MDELGVHVFQVGENEELFEACVVAHVAVFAGIGAAPLCGSQAEESDVENVGFVGVCDGGLFRRDFWRDEVALDRIGVDAVVDLGEGAVEVPCEG